MLKSVVRLCFFLVALVGIFSYLGHNLGHCFIGDGKLHFMEECVRMQVWSPVCLFLAD